MAGEQHRPPHMKYISALLLIVFVIYLHDADGAPPTWNHDNIAYHDVGGYWIGCHDVTVPIGHQFVSCTVAGGKDSFQQCPKGTYQPDRSSSIYEPVCTEKVETCSSFDEIEVFQNCSLANHPCFDDGRCSVSKGKCGTNCRDCSDVPTDCPQERINQDCSCSLSTTLNPSRSTTTPSLRINNTEINTGNSTNYIDVVVNSTEVFTTKRTSNNETTAEEEQENQQHVKVILIILCSLLFVAVISLAVYLKFKPTQRKSANETFNDENAVAQNNRERPTAEVRPFISLKRQRNIIDDGSQAEHNAPRNINNSSSQDYQAVYRPLSLSSLLDSDTI